MSEDLLPNEAALLASFFRFKRALDAGSASGVLLKDVDQVAASLAASLWIATAVDETAL